MSDYPANPDEAYALIDRLREAKTAALKLADERAKEAVELRAKLKVSNDDKIALYAAINDLRTELASARKALEPFALDVGAVSLSKALGHITREHLLAAKAALTS